MWYETTHSATFSWVFGCIGGLIRDTFASFFGSTPPDLFRCFLYLLMIWFVFCFFAHLVKGTKSMM